ncbi:MAG: Protein translocase subunit SecD [Hyphomicrobiaceae bacterium hypho_1]
MKETKVMLFFSRWKIITILSICFVAFCYALPNIFPAEAIKSWPTWLPKKQIPLGLDLRGGAHLLYTLDANKLRASMLRNLRRDVRKTLISAKIKHIAGRGENGIRVRISNKEDMLNALEKIRQLSQPSLSGVLLNNSKEELTVTQVSDKIIHVFINEASVRNSLAETINGAIEIIRRRVNSFGTAEPNIMRQGTDRILVQVPGVEDTSSLKDLIGKTAKLTFHEVHPTNGILSTFQPARGEYRSYPSAENSSNFYNFYFLKEIPVLRGDLLKNALQGYDQFTNEPVISFTFNQEGARIFAKFTTQNINRPFAIVLDGKVLSAPVIREPILGGSGQISGGFSSKTANELAIQLRSGSLPADLTVVEERTVGPSLGSDSIKSGLIAGTVGIAAVILITILVYGTFGIFAVLGLILNGIFIVALMTKIGFVLTLPGIAGLILTIGMAVDANVLIYERIKEELACGKKAIVAIDLGFKRAIVTIFDSQLTTLVAAIIMFWLGSGPIRGFAITLSIGIFTSIFTSMVIVRALVSLWFQTKRKKGRDIIVPI